MATVSFVESFVRTDADQVKWPSSQLHWPLTHGTLSSILQTFDDLLAAARRQPEPQRLLLVFARAECPTDASPAERAAFERGEGGALAPIVCVDKLPQEIPSFAALHEESKAAIDGWRILFVAAMDGRGGHAPNSDEAVQPLQLMVEQIKGGRVGRFLAVDCEGKLVNLSRG